MAAKAFKKIVATIGKYTKNGEEKKRYANVGTLFQQDDGNFSIKLDTIPVGPEWSGWLSCYELDAKKDAAKDEEVDF